MSVGSGERFGNTTTVTVSQGKGLGIPPQLRGPREKVWEYHYNDGVSGKRFVNTTTVTGSQGKGLGIPPQFRGPMEKVWIPG